MYYKEPSERRMTVQTHDRASLHVFSLFLHPEIHSPISERHAEGDAHQDGKPLLHAGKGEGNQEGGQDDEISQDGLHLISVSPVAP